MEIMTAVHATPDLDNLLPAESSETKVCTPAEMAALINSSTIRVKTGLMRIFSQEIEINGQDLFTLESSKFFPDVDVLLINLSGDVQVKIRHPKIIFQSSTFLKIVRAQEIRIEYRRSDSDCYINFKTSEKQSIEAKKNDGNIGTLRKANSAYPAFDFLA